MTLQIVDHHIDYETRKRVTAVLTKAIRRGDVVPANTCSECGAAREAHRRLDAHHHNGYDDPLDVVWLCRSCHMRVHTAHMGSVAGHAALRQRYTPAELNVMRSEGRRRGAKKISFEDRSAQMKRSWETRRSHFTAEQITEQARRGGHATAQRRMSAS